jgi:serine/threonine protein kinase
VTLSKPFGEIYVVEQVIHDGGERCRIKKVRSMEDGRFYVVKEQAKLQIRGKRGDVFRQMTERMMNLPESRYVTKVLACYEDDCYYYTILENLEGDDLYAFFRTLHPKQKSSTHHLFPPLDPEEREPEVRKIMFQMLKSLQHLHSQGLIHKDVKLENFVFKEKPKSAVPATFDFFSIFRVFNDCTGPTKRVTIPSEMKLIDFDFIEEWNAIDQKVASNQGLERQRTVLGTDGYIAPEVYLGSPCPKSDVFGVGVILYIMMSGRMPFSSSIFDDEEDENYVGSPKMGEIHGKLEKYQVWFGRVWDQCPEARDLCAAMLEVDAAKRPDTYQALRHPWFGGGGPGLSASRSVPASLSAGAA